MNQFFQRLFGNISNASRTPFSAEAGQTPHVLTTQEVQAVAGGPAIRNDPT